ncbi:hypothetical protein GS504_00875 [Rhodococcus hoagii]|nr:hypothetical protein [Prescottella equi]NKS72205.1 hypothetical protein [Prescottella equi]
MTNDQKRLDRGCTEGKYTALTARAIAARRLAAYCARVDTTARIPRAMTGLGAFSWLLGVGGTAVTYRTASVLSTDTPVTGWQIIFTIAVLGGLGLVIAGSGLRAAAKQRELTTSSSDPRPTATDGRSTTDTTSAAGRIAGQLGASTELCGGE